MEAHGSVVVTQKDQVATGDLGIFEVKLNVVTLIGNVTMTQGQNVIRGQKLTVDLNTNVSRVESGRRPRTGPNVPAKRRARTPQAGQPPCQWTDPAPGNSAGYGTAIQLTRKQQLPRIIPTARGVGNQLVSRAWQWRSIRREVAP